MITQRLRRAPVIASLFYCLIIGGCSRGPRWPASPAMTFNANGGFWCTDGLLTNGYVRTWMARKDGFCYEVDAPTIPTGGVNRQ